MGCGESGSTKKTKSKSTFLFQFHRLPLSNLPLEIIFRFHQHCCNTSGKMRICLLLTLMFSTLDLCASQLDRSSHRPPTTTTRAPIPMSSLSPQQSSDGTVSSEKPHTVTNTTVPTIVPVSPAGQVKYHMQLSSTGPAVLDSSIEFSAQLIPLGINDTDHWPTKFVYEWMNMADMTVHKTTGRLTSRLTLYQSSDDHTAGEFLMTVSAVFKHNPTKMAAFQVIKFTLTEKLNGHLILQQNMEYQRFPNVFSTNRPVEIYTMLHDHFKAEFNVSFSFFWYEGSRFLNSTKLPVIRTTVRKPANFTVMALVLAESTDSVRLINRKRAVVKNSASLRREDGSIGDGPIFKNGRFMEQVFFKDPLEDCVVVRVDTEPGDRSVKVGAPALLNITCLGSGPSSVCFNISGWNETIPSNETCQPRNFTDHVHHQVQIVLNSTGWSDVHIYIYNDVSTSYKLASYFGYNPDSVDVPALVFPTVFGILGVIIVIIGAMYILRLRKRPHVEVADFDFHPSLTSSSSRSGPETMVRFTMITNKLRYMLFRSRHRPQQRRPSLDDETSSMFEEESPEVKALYGSL